MDDSAFSVDEFLAGIAGLLGIYMKSGSDKQASYGYISHKSGQAFFFNVMTVISGQMPRRPEKARKPNPRLT